MRECTEEGCTKQPSYGLEGEKASKCKSHMTNDMIDVVHLKCIKCKKKRPSFGIEGETPSHCSSCKSNDMIYLINIKKCKCGKNAIYGIKGEKAICCIKCKTDEMINLKYINNRCKCGKSPSYRIKGEKAICCKDCKTDEMVNLINNRCKCGKTPSYGIKGEKAICCSLCKTDEMVDLKHGLCNCGFTAGYGIKGEKAICCSLCKTDEMIDLVRKFCSCGSVANFGLIDKYPSHCSKCKTEDMIRFTNRCKSNKEGILCTQSSNPKYNGYCTHCFANLFPDDPLTLQIRQKSKENLVRDYINSKFYGFIHDTPLWIGGCDCTHRRRIDHRKLIGNTLLCVETDENQHKYYNGDDEDSRYDDLMMIHGGKFIFIRFNPDKYKVRGEIRDPDMNTRLDKLERVIKKQIERIENEENEDIIEIYSMYYDRE
jgi:hypothetical protein